MATRLDWPVLKYASICMIFILMIPGVSTVQAAGVTFGPEINLDPRVLSSETLLPVDLDGDGDLDLVTTAQWNRMTNQVVWLESNGATATTFTTHVVSERYTGRVVAADLDRDGDMDLISNGYNLMWHKSNGAKPPVFTDQLIVNYTDASVLCAADLNKDGNVDLILGRSMSKSLIWLENSGGANPTFTEHQLVDALPERCSSIAVNDLDKDGDLDLIIACGDGTTPGHISYWLENNGASPLAVTCHPIDLEDSGVITLGDINRDGCTDLLIGSNWYQHDGGSPVSFTRHPVYSRIGKSALVDFDGDGDLDILALDAAASTILGCQVYWFENDGAKPTPGYIYHLLVNVPYYFYPRYWYVRDIAVCDLDRDGDADPLLLYNNHGVLWYPNQRLSPKPVTLFKPNGGEKFKTGHKIEVAWRTDPTTAGTAVRMELWRNTSARMAILQERATASADNGVGSLWVALPPVATRSDYRVRLVSLKNAGYSDFSDAPFTITNTSAIEPAEWLGYR